MRKDRCGKCGSIFYPTNGQKECQNCTGDAPSSFDKAAADKAITDTLAAGPSTTPQTVSVETLKRGRKPKATDAAG